MKRKNFLTAILAALGVGGSLGLHSRQSDVLDPPAPAPPYGPIEGRLRATIARDRAHGHEVNYFHTNWATLNDLWEEIGMRIGPQPGYQSFVYNGVVWWGCEHMAHHEILVSDVGMSRCPRCGGRGELHVDVDWQGRDMNLAAYHVSPIIPMFSHTEPRPCPGCSDGVYGPRGRWPVNQR